MPSGASDLVDTSYGPLGSWALAAFVVFVLILGLMFFAKRALGRGGGLSAKRGPRLTVLDVAAVDQKRRLVLIRRDDVEHLLLIGGQNDLLVESGIIRNPASPQQLRQDDPPKPVEPDDTRARREISSAPAVAPQPRASDSERGSSPLRRPLPRNAASSKSIIAPTDDTAPAYGNAPDVRATPTMTDPAFIAQQDAQPFAASSPSRDGTASRAGSSRIEPTIGEPLRSEKAMWSDAADRSGSSNRGANHETPIDAPVSDRSQGEKTHEVPDFLRRPVNARRTSDPANGSVTPAQQVQANHPPAVPENNRTPGLDSAVNDATQNRQAVARDENSARLAFAAPIVGPGSPAAQTSPIASDVADAPVATPSPASSEQNPASTEAGSVETQKRPLSVRSFATVIQSRRMPDAVQSPANRHSPEAGLSSASDRQSPTPTGENDPDDALNRQTDTNNRTVAAATRPLTLEEEMQQLFSDFGSDDRRQR